MDHIDFLPERIKARRARNRRLMTQGWLIGLCAAGLVVLGYVRQDGVRKAQAQLSLLSERKANVEMQLRQRDALEQQLADYMIKKRISDQLGSRVNTIEILAELGRLLPKSMALTSLSLDPVQVQLAVKTTGSRRSSNRTVEADAPGSQEINRVRLVLTGLAPSDVEVANFIGQLAACRLFDEVNMGYVKKVEFRGREAREWQASCYVAR